MSRRPLQLILASTSSTRRRILESAGISFEVRASHLDESKARGRPDQVVQELAVAKATKAARQSSSKSCLVLGCDSLLELDGQGLGKPHTGQVAVQRWQDMAGRWATLWTGYCLIGPGSSSAQPSQVTRTVSTEVHFAQPSESEIQAYVATGEPLEVAGAFTIEGYGSAFVAEIRGDHNNVLGLSVHTLREMLAQLNIPITELWK